MSQALSDWAVPQLERLLPLDEDSLREVINYTESLSKPDAAEHLKNLLGESPQALEFISAFQSRRLAKPLLATPASSNPPSQDVSEAEVPRPSARPRKKKQPLNKLPPPRQVEQHGNTTNAYMKKNEDDYISASSNRHSKATSISKTLPSQSEPDALRLPTTGSNNASPSQSPAPPESSKPSRLPPSAAGALISDGPNSRSASPGTTNKAKAKVNVSGGTSMRGASSTLSDLDAAIRTLELQTNPSLSSSADNDNDTKRRRCNCMAQRHPILAATPNCVSCGKIVCLKEGLGPCTFCGARLLSAADLQAMIRVLRDERGREKTQAHNAAHRRPAVAAAPRAFATPASGSGTATPDSSSGGSDDERLAAARAHRDRLLAFQAQNARRTTVRDEVADFATPDDGVSLWASPQERALQLKRQQRALREQEWAARPEWEKRRVVVSVDVSSGKAVRRMANVERPQTPDGSDDAAEEELDDGGEALSERQGGGKFGRNPLLGGLIKPVFQQKGKGKGNQEDAVMSDSGRRSTWRRVQDDNDDNEELILDGGAYGQSTAPNEE